MYPVRPHVFVCIYRDPYRLIQLDVGIHFRGFELGYDGADELEST